MSALVEEFERFSNLFPEPVLLLANSGHLCAANAAAKTQLLRLSLLSEEDQIFHFTADEPEKVASYLKCCSRSAQPLPALFTFKSPDGARLEYRCQGSAFRSRDDKQRALVVLRFAPKELSTSRFVGLNQQIEALRNEVARRIKVERDLAEQRQLLQVTLTSIGDAVIATDVEGKVTFLNPIAEEHIGYSSSEAIGRPLQDIFVIRNEDTGVPVESPVQLVLKRGSVVGLANHTVLVRRDGVELPIDDSAAPIRDSTGKLLGVILVFQEVSESRKLQRELMLQTNALRDADRRKDQFLAVLAHELRNPLAPMRNGLQIARIKAESDQALQSVIAMMERQLVHLVRLVDDLMDISRVSRGVIELRRAPVFISDVIVRSVESVRADMEARKHDFRIDLPSQNITVDGDADRLTQVVSNLLTNSAKYSHDVGSIQLSVVEDAEEVCIRVRDKGVGIPRDQIENVFEMFSQVRTHQGRYEGGLGIGLALVRTLVQLHGGSVTANSEGPGKGSTFTVRLPILKSNRTDDPLQSPQLDRQGSPLRILIADDNIDAARTLALLLEADGHQVRMAMNGRVAVACATEFKPAIIFMDVGMPDLDGLEATRLIRELPGSEEVVIVALTGWGQPQDRERTRSAGVDRHIVKPISPEQIAEVITLAVSRSLNRVTTLSLP